MGRSRGNFNADEDPSQRSRRKKNAASGENSESSAAGQVTPDGKKALYHCNYCNKDITGRIRIKCAVCPDFDLCIECFSVGAEVHPHKSNHSYMVMENLSFPLLCADWNADEESLLLEGIEMYGMGNWAEIAEHVGTKVKDFCIEHYKTAYLESPCFPLPDMTYATGKNRTELLAMAKEHGDGATFTSKASNLAQVKNSPSSVKLEDNMSDRSTGDKKPKPSKDNVTSLMEQSGYNPKRQEFDPEYDNDAEQLLADMEFKDTDTKEERELKLRVLRIYNKRLDERKRRKDFIIERDLLRPSPFEEGLSAEEKALCHRYDCFMRFHSKEDHEKLLETVIKEHRVLKRINELKEAAAAGCRSSDEARRYFELKRKREAEENGRAAKGNAQLGSSSQRGFNAPAPAESGFDIMAYPEANLLSNNEKRVCCELRLTPPDYLRMQEAMSMLIFKGHISKKSDSYPVFRNVEQIKVDWVYDMLVKKGIATP